MAQAGHAFVGTVSSCASSAPDLLSAYHANFPESPGTKVCLHAKNLDVILKAKAQADASGIPNFLVVDSGCPDFYNGEPIVTALGLGPVKKADVKHITNSLKLV